jgi:uncharacterized protein YjbI with pentapeptide repeats
MSDNVINNLQAFKAQLQQGSIEGCLVEDVDLTPVDLAGIHVRDSSFKRVGLSETDLTASDLSRVKFSAANLRGALLSQSLIRATSFFSSELIEGRFDGSTMSNTSFYSSTMGNADFSGARIQSSMFNGCELFGVSFSRSLLLNTKFDAKERGNVTLDRANFANSVLIDCDLMGANLYGANFDHALLIKVDLRHANLNEASFQGAHLIDVQLDVSELEPAQQREITEARVQDPWRHHGFMNKVLGNHSPEEMIQMLEYVMRTYIIEGTQSTTPPDSFSQLMAQMKSAYDFPELDLLRLDGMRPQVYVQGSWQPLTSQGPVTRSAGDPQPITDAPATDASASQAVARPASPTERDQAPPGDPEEQSTTKANEPPKNVGRSKRFRHLEID